MARCFDQTDPIWSRVTEMPMPPNPSPTPGERRGPRLPLRALQPIGESLLIGSALGLADSRYAGDLDWIIPAYVVAGLGLGYRHAGRAWPCWVPLGVGLYLAHVAAIAFGRQPPYVEATYAAARWTLLALLPAGLGLALGAGVRWLLAVAGWFRRKDGPSVQLWPRTISGMIVTIAKLAITWSLTRWVLFDSGTMYAPGFSEGRFQEVHAGMTTDQVEAILGPPIGKRDWQTPDNQMWAYTDQASATSNYHRRWIMVESGKVIIVINDYWYD